MKPKVLAVIPARFASRRFPGKALSIIAGKTMLEHIYREVSEAKLIDRVVVATDSEEIHSATEAFGGEVVITSKRHRTGSDRSAEVLQKLGGEILVSVQADHLGVKSGDYDRVLRAMLISRDINYATIIKKVETEEHLYDPNRVKITLDSGDNALWFSRYPIPFLQGINGDRLSSFDFYYHIGVYFYRRAALMKFHSWPQSRHEKAESLEQLRILENREKIRAFKIKSAVISIDTPEDLKAIKKLLLK